MSITVVPIPRRQTSMTEDTKSWTHGMTNVSIPEVNILENSSTLAVFVSINLSIKLGFVSVNGYRETYFVDALRYNVIHNQNSYHEFTNFTLPEETCITLNKYYFNIDETGFSGSP